jgi:nitrite reductase (NADH) large subunit
MNSAPVTAWRCSVCGYVHAGPEPPELCPVCGAGRTEFAPYAEPAAEAKVDEPNRWRCMNCGCFHDGAEPPEVCPICGAARVRFEAAREVRPGSEPSVTRVVIVGAGVAGVSAAETIRRESPNSPITLISADPEPPYYRLNLTRYLAGEIARATLPMHPQSWYEEQRVELVRGATVTRIFPDTKRIAVEDTRSIPYERLLLALGSHPFVPPLEGAERDGVFTLRTAADADEILRRTNPGDRCVCIGGGVLGIEAAGALARRNRRVTMLEGHGWLMPRQLNPAAAGYLERHMRRIGVDVLKNARTRKIAGNGAVTGVLLEDGTTLPAQLVILATGVRPNTALARKAGIEVNNGIVVDNHLRTSAPDVFAAGDVAEHNGQVYGSWAPAQYQGSIAALNMLGVPTVFGGLPRSNTVKALGLDLTSIGRFEPEDGTYLALEQEEESSYAEFVFRDGRMVGAILVGRAELAGAVKKAVESAADFSGLLKTSPACADVIRRLEKHDPR